MLTEYKGSANNREVFQYLVGETIKAAFMGEDGKIYIVVGSGPALVFGGPGGGPSYWVDQAESVKRVIDERRAQIERRVAELRDLGGVEP